MGLFFHSPFSRAENNLFEIFLYFKKFPYCCQSKRDVCHHSVDLLRGEGNTMNLNVSANDWNRGHLRLGIPSSCNPGLMRSGRCSTAVEGAGVWEWEGGCAVYGLNEPSVQIEFQEGLDSSGIQENSPGICLPLRLQIHLKGFLTVTPSFGNQSQEYPSSVIHRLFPVDINWPSGISKVNHFVPHPFEPSASNSNGFWILSHREIGGQPFCDLCV